MQIADYTLAVDRYKKGEADFIRCKAFGKLADVAAKYYKKGMRIAVSGHLQTGSYTNRDGVKVYTTDVIIESQEFAQSKNETQESVQSEAWATSNPKQESLDEWTTTNKSELPFE